MEEWQEYREKGNDDDKPRRGDIMRRRGNGEMVRSGEAEELPVFSDGLCTGPKLKPAHEACHTVKAKAQAGRCIEDVIVFTLCDLIVPFLRNSV